MRYAKRIRITMSVTAMILILIPAALLAEEDERPDLSGTWILDAAASDDIEHVLKKSMGAGGQGGGKGSGMAGKSGSMGGRGGGGGRGGRSGAMGSAAGGGDLRKDGRDPADRFEAMAKELRRGTEQLEIFHEAGELNLTDGTGATQLLNEGLESTVWTPRGERLATAKWEGNALRVRYRSKGGKENRKQEGPTNTVFYKRDGDRLTVTRLINSPGLEEPVQVRFVYRQTGARSK